jgi:hydrogenase-4 component F
VALFGALLHTLNHALTKALMFLAFGNVQSSYVRVGGRGEASYVGVLQAMPGTGVLLALGGLALVGSPPFNIFLSEFIILWAAVAQAMEAPGWWTVAAVALFLLSVTLIFSGLVRHLGRMLLGAPPDNVKNERIGQVLPLALLFLVVLLFGFTVPTVGPLELRALLEQSVDVVRCGRQSCP